VGSLNTLQLCLCRQQPRSGSGFFQASLSALAAALALVGELADRTAVVAFPPVAPPLSPGHQRQNIATLFPTALRGRERPAAGAPPFRAFRGRAAKS
jgi:hypothetical protein